MSYIIRYEPEKNKRYPQKKTTHRYGKYGLAVLLLLGALFLSRRDLKALPETASRIAAAAEQVRMGMPVKEAMTDFYLDLLDDAKKDSN